MATVEYVTIPISLMKIPGLSPWAMAVAQSDSSRGEQDNLTKHMQHGVRSVSPPSKRRLVKCAGDDLLTEDLPRVWGSLGGPSCVPTSLSNLIWVFNPKAGIVFCFHGMDPVSEIFELTPGS